MEKTYKSNKEFMMEQFPEFSKSSTEKINPVISLEKKETVDINPCTHEHCVLYDNISIGKGKITLIYRCTDCGEQFLDCKSYLGGMTIQFMHSFSSKTVSYKKIMKKTIRH